MWYIYGIWRMGNPILFDGLFPFLKKQWGKIMMKLVNGLYDLEDLQRPT